MEDKSSNQSKAVLKQGLTVGRDKRCLFSYQKRRAGRSFTPTIFMKKRALSIIFVLLNISTTVAIAQQTNTVFIAPPLNHLVEVEIINPPVIPLPDLPVMPEEFQDRIEYMMEARVASYQGPETSHNHSEADMVFAAQVVWAEANGEGFHGMLMVAEVMANRLNHPAFPNNMREMLTAPRQWQPVRTGAYRRAPQDNSEARAALEQALAGNTNLTNGSTYFRTVVGSPGSWHDRTLNHQVTYRGHMFFSK